MPSTIPEARLATATEATPLVSVLDELYPVDADEQITRIRRQIVYQIVWTVHGLLHGGWIALDLAQLFVWPNEECLSAHRGPVTLRGYLVGHLVLSVWAVLSCMLASARWTLDSRPLADPSTMARIALFFGALRVHWACVGLYAFFYPGWTHCSTWWAWSVSSRLTICPL